MDATVLKSIKASLNSNRRSFDTFCGCRVTIGAPIVVLKTVRINHIRPYGGVDDEPWTAIYYYSVFSNLFIDFRAIFSFSIM